MSGTQSGPGRRRGIVGFFGDLAVRIWGPPDLDPDKPQPNPYTGTKYDPEVKRAAREARRRAKGRPRS